MRTQIKRRTFGGIGWSKGERESFRLAREKARSREQQVDYDLGEPDVVDPFNDQSAYVVLEK